MGSIESYLKKDGVKMAQYWCEESNGLLFSDMPDNSCVRERLEMLYYEGMAEERENNYFLAYDKLVMLPQEDVELLALPENNPYQLAVVANGTIGQDDLHYIVQILSPNGQPFVNPEIHGCILHVDGERVYMLNNEQYRMVCLMEESNRLVPTMDRRERNGYSIATLGRMQRYAKKTDARLDSVLSSHNQEVHVAEKIDVDVSDDGKGNMYVNPILLEEGTGNELDDDYAQKFKNQFLRMGDLNVYKTDTEDGKRVRVVCPPAVREGLAKVKSINKKKIPAKEAERYQEQPGEIFEDDVFIFREETHKKKVSLNRYESDESVIENSKSVWDDMPEEGEFIPTEYSDRIKGISEIVRSVYNGSGYKTDWLGQEGTALEGDVVDKDIVKNEASFDDGKEIDGLNSASNQDDRCRNDANDNVVVNSNRQKYMNEGDVAGADCQAITKHHAMALDIKPNFDVEDYAKGKIERNGILDVGALKEGIKLYPYQEEAVKWMYRVWHDGESGVLLADDMGLGKTLQTLAFIAKLKKGLGNIKGKPVLIVGPTALLKNWEEEYEKFIEKGVFSGIISLHGNNIRRFQTGEATPNGKKKLEIIIPEDSIALTTYETLRDYQFSFAEVSWGIVILDEAQKIKNPSTGVTVAVKAMKYDYTVCLSGTPVENSWSDLWSIMDFVKPLQLGTLHDFREKYVKQLKMLNDDLKGIENLGVRLKNKLNPFFMRRMKNDMLPGLPKKTIHFCRRDMPDYQKKRYLSVLDAARNNALHPLVTIAKLRDISLHPDIGLKQPAAFYEMVAEDVISQSARLIETFGILRNVKMHGEKVLIFVVSKNMQLVIRHLIKSVFEIQVDPPINGDMNGVGRQNIIDKFNNREGFGVLILSPEAAGVGFTITSANHVIHLSRTWNPAKEDQATDRVYRIGQKRDVHVYLPIACLGNSRDSFDDKLNDLLEYKRRLSENVLFPTGDDASDGQKIFNEVLKNEKINNREKSNYLTIEEIDTFKGLVFEQIVADLFKKEDGVIVKKTKGSNDYGADIVVIYEDRKHGLLIQCKHQEKPFEKSLNAKGVQDICAAVNYYKRQDDYFGLEFETAVVTNADKFSSGARELANANGVSLIARKELESMLEERNLINVY